MCRATQMRPKSTTRSWERQLASTTDLRMISRKLGGAFSSSPFIIDTVIKTASPPANLRRGVYGNHLSRPQYYLAAASSGHSDLEASHRIEYGQINRTAEADFGDDRFFPPRRSRQPSKLGQLCLAASRRPANPSPAIWMEVFRNRSAHAPSLGILLEEQHQFPAERAGWPNRLALFRPLGRAGCARKSATAGCTSSWMIRRDCGGAFCRRGQCSIHRARSRTRPRFPGPGRRILRGTHAQHRRLCEL